MVRKYHVFFHYLTVTNTWMISKKMMYYWSLIPSCSVSYKTGIHIFNTCAKLPDMQALVYVSGERNGSFSEHFIYVLNG